MKKFPMVLAAIMLMNVVFFPGCKPEDNPNNGGGNNSGGIGTYNGHEYVDLGLPSGTLWATCNVGATIPEDYGYYFAWGEIEPKTTYNWSTYKYANGASWEYPEFTKYCTDLEYGYNGFTDNLNTLEPSDDAATANWGKGCCLPTVDQWRELYQNTTHTWTTQNGVNGRLFTASNGNSLFVPAAGFHWIDDLFGIGGGNYWSSSLGMGNPVYPWYFELLSGRCDVDGFSRPYGLSVRPVRSAR